MGHWLYTYWRYNIACEHFDQVTEKCRIWDSEKLPIECQIYVCGIRTYTQKELDKIQGIYEKWKPYLRKGES